MAAYFTATRGHQSELWMRSSSSCLNGVVRWHQLMWCKLWWLESESGCVWRGMVDLGTGRGPLSRPAAGIKAPSSRVCRS
jgi:hypothetical protein